MINIDMDISNPDTTIREIYEANLETIEDQIEGLDALIDGAQAILPTLEYQTAQVLTQTISSYRGARMSLDNRRIVLANVIRGWDGLEPLPSGTFTPTLPTYPA